MTLFEVKLTQTYHAEEQMLNLYAPLLRHIYKREVLSIQITKGLRTDIALIDHPVTLWQKPDLSPRVWHFIG